MIPADTVGEVGAVVGVRIWSSGEHGLREGDISRHSTVREYWSAGGVSSFCFRMFAG